MLRLFGVAKTRVMYDTTNMAHNGNNSQSYTHREMLTEKKEFLSYDVQLAAFGGTAASGSHNFPFSVMLPPGLPPSMEVKCTYGWRFLNGLYLFCCRTQERPVKERHIDRYVHRDSAIMLFILSLLRGNLCCG